MARNADIFKKQHTAKKQEEKEMKQAEVQSERQHINQLAVLADQQRQEALAVKQRAGQDAKTHLDQIEKARHDEFEAKKNDRSNHEQSMAYKRDDRERSKAGIEHYRRQQQSMQDELNSQS